MICHRCGQDVDQGELASIDVSGTQELGRGRRFICPSCAHSFRQWWYSIEKEHIPSHAH
jgi:hypothetical protein